MNVEIETEAEQFPEKEYINGIFAAVHGGSAHWADSCEYMEDGPQRMLMDVWMYLLYKRKINAKKSGIRPLIPLIEQK